MIDFKVTWLDRVITKSQARSKLIKEVIEHIANGGHSNHSPLGSTLQAVIKGLEKRGASYRLTAHPGKGYYIEGIPNEPL